MGSEKQISFNSAEDRSQVAAQAIEDPEILAALVDNLSSDQRRIRQFSAAAIKEVASQEPKILLKHVPSITDGLHRPEAQTRWECLETLAFIAPLDPPGMEEVVEGAETSLFDEESGLAHLAAFRFLCAFGALDTARASQVWSLIDEGIQVYHGDPEFVDMLASVEYFASGNIGKEIKSSLRARMDFDANNYLGVIGRLAAQIVEVCEKK
ncbi:MAG: hypothetical protein LBP91_05130 [Coriobacteriales bacterium]|jgi:hypothetical protein|nr:hypothetical protein [Coriobacteriales bacterium]